MGITQSDELETHHAVQDSAFEAEFVQIQLGVKTEFVAKRMLCSEMLRCRKAPQSYSLNLTRHRAPSGLNLT